MAKRKPEKTYKGVLATPSPMMSGQSPEELPPEERLEHDKILARKMDALLDHWQIDFSHPEKWKLLAFLLAWRHVPGFAISNKPGRKADRENLKEDLILFREIEFRRGAMSRSRKAEQLANNHPLFKGGTPGTLRDRYYRLKDEQSAEGKRMRAIIAEALAWKESKK